MKVFKILLAILIPAAILAGLFGCSSSSDEETPGNQIGSVIRGDLTLDITAAGNLALSRTEDLAIDLFYQQGTIAEVLVEDGDAVTEGQVLVRLDTDEWDDQLSTLEDLVTARERDLLQAQINLKTGEQTIKNARDTVSSRETSIVSAQISVIQAENNLKTSITTIDYATATAALNKAKTWYDYVSYTLKESGNIKAEDWELAMQHAKENLDIAQATYDNVLAGYTSEEVTLKKKQLDIAKRSLAAAEEDLADAKDDVTLKEQSITLTQGKLQDAEKALADARKDVENAQSKSPEIRAPFDGFVTKVNVAGGDEVMKGTVAVQLADPNKFEADILVSEMDILQVKLGGDATVQVDALSGVSLPAKVTHIAPTATIQSGVVNYAVRVELESLEAIAQERQEMRQQAMADIAAGELPIFLQRAVEEGRMTREQAEEMMKNGPPSGFTPPEGFTPPAGFTPPEGMEFPAASGSQAQAQLPTMTLTDFQLRQGLTVTVSIIVAERSDVLLVPNGAVTSEGLQSYVQVVTASGETEKRAVQTGLSDWQYTEITDGLTEGEQIIVPLNTATSSTTRSTTRGMNIFGPGPR